MSVINRRAGPVSPPMKCAPFASGPPRAALVLSALLAAIPCPAAASSLADPVAAVQPRIVKIVGAGGLRGLEAYQSGFLISGAGHVLTAWSHVFDADAITVTLDDGRKFSGDLLVGADPVLGIAVVKLPVEDVPYFDLDKAATASNGSRVLAFSNLFGVATGNEPASVQRGVVAAVTNLAARRGVFKTLYAGPVYVVDAVTNNPGAAGGALTDLNGQLLALIGKELRNAQDNTWLNYAVPIGELRSAIDDIQAGKSRPYRGRPEHLARNPLSLVQRGVVLVPEVVDNTPPFVDAVIPGSVADRAGLLRDDLILFVDSVLVQSLDDVEAECRRIEQGAPVRLTVRRDQQLKVILLAPDEGSEGAP